MEFKFKEKSDTACFVCSHVFNRELPILLAIHDNDSSWQFLCGEDGHDESHIRIISLEEAVNIDDTINELCDMPPGISANRQSVNSVWELFQN